MARTNIDIDEELITRVMRHYAFKTKREAVDFALREVDVIPMTKEEVLAMQGFGWEGDLEEMKQAELDRSKRLERLWGDGPDR